MIDALLVAIVQRVQHLLEHPPCRTLLCRITRMVLGLSQTHTCLRLASRTTIMMSSYLQGSLCHDFVEELAAWHELHDHVDLVLGGHDLFQVHNVRMVQVLHDGNLPFDLIHHVLPTQLLLVQHLCCLHSNCLHEA